MIDDPVDEGDLLKSTIDSGFQLPIPDWRHRDRAGRRPLK